MQQHNSKIKERLHKHAKDVCLLCNQVIQSLVFQSGEKEFKATVGSGHGVIACLCRGAISVGISFVSHSSISEVVERE